MVLKYFLILVPFLFPINTSTPLVSLHLGQTASAVLSRQGMSSGVGRGVLNAHGAKAPPPPETYLMFSDPFCSENRLCSGSRQ